MGKIIIRAGLAVLLVWAGWLGYQYHAKSQTAAKLAQEKADEFYATDVNALSEKAGKGYEYKTTEIDGKKFWLRWAFNKSGDDAIEMTGSVDFIELLPFTEARCGHSLNYKLKLKYE